ncbi:MAG: hypothetical protein AB8G15_02945 [Saprospiraceae bacterium]
MKKRIELVSILGTLILVFIVGAISIEGFGEYGWNIFIFLPLLIGFLPPFITSRTKRVTRNKSYLLSFITLGLACLGLLIFALEGLICIAMALPILGLLTLLGSYLAYVTQGEKKINSTNLILILGALTIGLMSFDQVNEPEGLIPVRTKIIVNANINTVWNNVVTFDKIPEPTDWIFKTGISYPTDATIEGTGVGAIRYCNFTTGSFVEPITTWDAPNLLQFDVKEQPIPMHELNPFWEVHPPHLEGYFKSYQGQFKLTKITKNQTALEGTTWYQVDITPEIYWKFWSDYVIHRIHGRVLNHIKREAEENEKERIGMRG